MYITDECTDSGGILSQFKWHNYSMRNRNFVCFLFFFISPEYSLLLVEQPVLTSSLHLSSMCAQGSVGGELNNCLILTKQ